MKEKKEICCSKAERTQVLRANGFSLDESRESPSTVNQLVVQMQELQDRVDCLNDSRDFEDLQPASSSGSLHASQSSFNFSEFIWKASPRFQPAA